jgi:UrcA family protein
MSHSKQAVSLAVICAASLGTAVALADSAKVQYVPSDLTTKARAVKLYRQIESAARDVCEQLDGRELVRHEHYTRCVDDAIARAVEQVHSSELTAIHLSERPRAPHPQM